MLNKVCATKRLLQIPDNDAVDVMTRRSAGTGRRIQEIAEARHCALQEHPAPEDPTGEDSDSGCSQVLERRSCSPRRKPPNFRSDLEDTANIYCDDTTSYSSASSWTDDRFERQAAEQVQGIFDNIEAHLYDGVDLPNEFEDLKEECRDWVRKFPHLWVTGRKVPPTAVSRFSDEHLDQNTSVQFIDRRDLVIEYDNALENERFVLQGVSLKTFSSFDDDEIEDFVDQPEENEEIIAVDYGEEIEHFSENGVQRPVDTESIQRCIEERLTEHIWSQVFSLLRPTLRNYVELALKASRISSATVHLDPDYPSSKKKFPLPRLPTAVLMNRGSADLEGVLTISSKTLQNRSTEKGARVPTGSTSAVTAGSSGSGGGAVSQSPLRVETRGKGRLVPLDRAATSATAVKTPTSADTKQQSAAPVSDSLRGAISRSWSRHFTLPPIDGGQQQPNVSVPASKQSSKSPLSTLSRTVSEPIQEKNFSFSRSPSSYVTSANPRKLSRIPTAVDVRTQPSLNLAISTLVISEGTPNEMSIQPGPSKPVRRRSSVTAGNRNQENVRMSASNYFAKKRNK